MPGWLWVDKWNCYHLRRSSPLEIENADVNCPVHNRCRILCLWSRLHETHTDLASLEQAGHPDYLSRVLRFSHWLGGSRTESTVEQQLHTLQPSTILLQIWLEMERLTWATYRLLRCSLTTSPSLCRSSPSWSGVLQWEWSVIELEMASEIASIYMEIVTEIVTEMVTEMVTGMVWELQMASGMLSGCKLIAYICFEEIHAVWWAHLLFCLRFLVETDEIALWEECWADWQHGYHYAK